MHKFFVNSNDIKGEKVHIFEDAGHISRVLRLGVGDEIIVFDGLGNEYVCELESVGKAECVAVISAVRECTSEARLRVALFQGIPKSGKMEVIIQKCTELGVAEIYPFFSKRSVVKLDSERDKLAKVERWQKVALEAAKQCGRGVTPIIHSPIEFGEVVEIAKNFNAAIMPYEVLGSSGKKDLRDVLSNNMNCENLGIIIGSEGGFDESEAELAKLNGINLVGLGERILRTETAGPAVLAVVMYEFDEI